MERRVLLVESELLGSRIKSCHKEKALQLFSEHFHCSQAVLAAFSEECGITEEQALKLGACFGSGMRKGEVCGACTGALMVLGLLYGQSDKEDLESRMQANRVNEAMMERFSEKCGSYICNELLGCDVRTEQGIQYARDHHLFTELCPRMVENAVDVLEKIISDEEQKTLLHKNPK